MLKTKRVLFRFYRNLIHNIIPSQLYKYEIGGIIHNYFISLLKPLYVSVMGKRIYLDNKDSLRLSTNPKGRDFELEVFKAYIKPGNVVLDIGAHIGYCTVIFSQLVGRLGRVYAFEPAPDNLKLLKKNIKINNLNNVVVMPYAVSNTNGKIKLFLSNTSQADHRTWEPPEERDCIEVNSVRLDDFLKKKDMHVSFVKIDIQGGELEAILSMNALLKKNKNIVIYTEYTPQYLKDSGVKPLEYIKKLISLGFQLYDVNETEKELQRTDLITINNNYNTQEGVMTNLLCIRNNFVPFS